MAIRVPANEYEFNNVTKRFYIPDTNTFINLTKFIEEGTGSSFNGVETLRRSSTVVHKSNVCMNDGTRHPVLSISVKMKLLNTALTTGARTISTGAPIISPNDGELMNQTDLYDTVTDSIFKASQMAALF